MLARMAWLFARLKPTFSAFAISLTSGNFSRTISTLPSVLWLSTTNTSPLMPSSALNTVRRHCSRYARTL
jgi:hypothetical protein